MKIIYVSKKVEKRALPFLWKDACLPCKRVVLPF